MRRLLRVLGICLLCSWPPGAGAQNRGEVTVPLSELDEIMDELAAETVSEIPPFSVCRIDRALRGAFQKGLFKGTLVERFEVLEPRGHVRVPILDAQVSLGEVKVNDRRTSLLKEGEMYTLGLERPGVYTVRLTFFWGEDQDRFARRLQFRLPEGGTTLLAVEIPEREIEPKLAEGVLTRSTPRENSTLVEGMLPPSGVVDFSWSRRVTHRNLQAVKMDAVVNTLFTVEEAVTKGVAAIELTVSEGETDTVVLALPRGIEVVKVEGDAVLQWATEEAEGGRLKVLLRYLVSDRTEMTVHFQAPADSAERTTLRMPLPLPAVPFTGAAGVHAPPGINLRILKTADAREMPPHELPPKLTGLSKTPLRFGFGFTAAPEVSLRVSRNAQIELTSTIIEEIQASTVVVEDGSEITKMKLRVRNNTREYLEARLPQGAVLTHSLVEGQTVRPAVVEGNAAAILFPLQKSERIPEGQLRQHTVRQGETLSDISNFYYSDPTRWGEILTANPGRPTPNVVAGERLIIPARQGAKMEESSFVIELAYRRALGRLGRYGSCRLQLPALDVDAMRVVWHLYFPRALEPLGFQTNLVQYSNLRYDPFRRLRHFVTRALSIRDVWAGGKYKNILSSRKGIYRDEQRTQAAAEGVRTAFPLVGERYRFKRILLGRESPNITVRYLQRELGLVAHLGAFLLGFGLMWLVLRFRSLRVLILSAIVLGGLLYVSHYLLGMRRRFLWGADLAILAAIIHLRAGPLAGRLKEILRAPWLAVRLLTFGNLFYIIGWLFVLGMLLAFPLFVSTAMFAVLLFAWRRARRTEGEEVSHG